MTMRHFTALALAGLMLAAASARGDEQREAFDLRWTRAADWEASQSLRLTITKGRLELTNRGGEPGWAATTTRWLLDDDATLTLRVAEARGAQVTVQAEWMAEGGQFLGAATAVDRVNESDTRVAVKLADLLPKASPGKPQPGLMRLKLWVGGDGGAAVIDELRITATRKWRNDQTRTAAAITAASPLAPDEGMTAAVEEEAIVMALDPGRPFAGLVVGEATAYSARAAVMLDLTWLARGRAGLQAVCFSAGGRHLGAVDLLKEIERPGVYEMPLSIYRSAFPAGTTQIRWKLWLGGEGAAARVAGLWLGELP